MISINILTINLLSTLLIEIGRSLHLKINFVEVIDELDYVINYDPTPSGDSPYSDAEYIITSEERDRKCYEQQKRISCP